MAKKRTADGKEKPQQATATARKPPKRPRDALDSSNQAPPGGQHPATSSKASETQNTEESAPNRKKKQKRDTTAKDVPKAPQPQPSKPQHQPARKQKQKQPRLPDNASISKRPIHHPAPPTPFSSASSPKTLYITTSSPFIPTVKRIRRILQEIARREAQSLSSHPSKPANRQPRKPLRANGRLQPADVEKEIVEASYERRARGVGSEEVFVKATGRAIERALQVGVHFQGENDCRVRVEMGSVQAIDDIEVRRGKGGEEAENGEDEGKGGKGKKWKDEDIPETRIRTLSSITVAIGPK